MDATDPTELDANGGAGHPASVDIDSAPLYTTGEHLEYLVGLITKEWEKTMVTRDNVSASPVTGPVFDEMSYYNYDDDTKISFQVGKLPEAIHQKVDDLQHMQRIGLPNLPALVKLANEKLEKSETPFGNYLDENGEEIELSFTEMLAEIAKSRLSTKYLYKKETGFDLTVVFVDKSGRMQMKRCLLQPDTDFASFLVLMDDYPKEFDLNVAWAASFWEKKIKELKEKGFDGHPKLMEAEQLIATHKATNYDDGPKWMFFKTNQQVTYAKPIENEHDFKKILDIVTHPKKNNRLACMVRTVDKDLILISDELKFFESGLQDSVCPSDEAVSPHNQGDQSDQQPDVERLLGVESFNPDNASLDIWARSVGVGLNLVIYGDDDDDDWEPMHLPREMTNTKN